MRIALIVIGALILWQALQLTLLLKATRSAWAFLQQQSNAVLERVGLILFFLGLLILLGSFMI
jgi:hypothetical protein